MAEAGGFLIPIRLRRLHFWLREETARQPFGEFVRFQWTNREIPFGVSAGATLADDGAVNTSLAYEDPVVVQGGHPIMCTFVSFVFYSSSDRGSVRRVRFRAHSP